MRQYLLLGLVMLALCTSGCIAISHEGQADSTQLEQLNQRVKGLDARVDALENKRAQTPAPGQK